ncbi:Zinc finger protein CONSTANS-LIKE 2 [Hirschfeldia incana]|nr:Zinc finger protein CONSTANS-LIKE 2 [Hirschfeldia incana]
MLKEESYESGGARACDTCRSAACTVYCEADSAIRVRVCDSCESAPAAFFCKADSASLCTACDAEIHSANPLARRHQRVPLSANSCSSIATDADDNNGVMMVEKEDEDEVASWLMLNPGKNNNNGFLFGVEYLDLVDYSSSLDNQFEDGYSQYQRSFAGGEDGVVPLQLEESTSHMQQSQHNFHLGVNYGCSTEPHYNYISVVPESTSSDTTKEAVDQVSAPPTQMVQKLTPADREASVLRYREKKKRRKFEKTIRYASRKAYAEVRPRIKGRFAKRIDMEADAEQLFTTSLMSNTSYGIVPSF